MNDGEEHPLVGQLEEMDRILTAFESPVVDEHAGLRLMDEHLRGRRDDIFGKLSRGETPTLHVVVLGPTAVAGTLPVPFLLRLLTALTEAVDDGAGLAEELRWAGGVPEGAGLTLEGPAAPGARAATESAGRSAAFVAAVTALLDTLESATSGKTEQAGPAAALLELVSRDWTRLELTWTAPAAEPRTVVLDPEELAATAG